MKRLFTNLLIVMLALVITACQSEETVSFSDEQLEEGLRTEIEKTDGELYESDFDELVELDLSGLGIQDLTGIEFLDDLKILSLEDNEINDFSLLKDLENLEEVNVRSNPVDEEQQALLDELTEQDVVVHFTEETEVVGSPDGPGGFLWKVENGDTTVYLQGTIHAGTEDFYPLNEKIENAYRESDVVVPEIDITDLNVMEVQQLTMDLGVFQDRTTIEDHIPEDVYSELSATLDELGLPLQMVESFKPWFLSSTIQQLMTEQLGFMHGVDQYFLDRAAQDDKEIIALETVEEQLGIFADTSDDYQIQMLEESLVDIDDYEEDMQELFSLYKEGDVDELLAALTEEEAEPSAEDQAFMEALNDERNYGMADTIGEFLEEDNGDTYFVIVGSLHLIMEPHVVSILEEEGYEVEHVY
ncbi:TraB/GumN family protein [Oceanobacillus sp. FSL K6-2867]|uniref:TraB/GumN family protein n=1 Tax=Oceanobacillus sp. FSL K6-2867 TaxID=2954748 RepID=UPI0030DC56DC